jgi:predicted anti-sigma-YlaC factor YlaD
MGNQDCKHLLSALSDYIDGEATAELCVEIERHLAECADCRALLNTLRKTLSLYREQAQLEMTTSMRERLYARLGLTELLSVEPPSHDRS